MYIYIYANMNMQSSIILNDTIKALETECCKFAKYIHIYVYIYKHMQTHLTLNDTKKRFMHIHIYKHMYESQRHHMYQGP